MVRTVDPNGKTSRLVIQATSDEEALLIKKFKHILMNHDETIGEFFMPIIQQEVFRREPSNPQTLLDPLEPSGHTLSRAQKETLNKFEAKEELRPKGTCLCCGKNLHHPSSEGFCSIECAEEYGEKH